MPLERLPDRFDGAAHRRLDSVVQKSDLNYSVLLIIIIDNSNGGLGTTRLCFPRAKKPIITHGELRDISDSARKRKSCREIRNLALLRAPAVVPDPPAPDTMTEIDLAQGLSGPFYCGTAVDGFYEYLTHNEKSFKNFESTEKLGMLSISPRRLTKHTHSVQASTAEMDITQQTFLIEQLLTSRPQIRNVDGEPYTQLGWDQSALGLWEIDMEHISRLDHILGYGRPLFFSRSHTGKCTKCCTQHPWSYAWLGVSILTRNIWTAIWTDLVG